MWTMNRCGSSSEPKLKTLHRIQERNYKLMVPLGIIMQVLGMAIISGYFWQFFKQLDAIIGTYPSSVLLQSRGTSMTIQSKVIARLQVVSAPI